MAIPRTDSVLVRWATNFGQKVSDPSYGVPAAQLAAFDAAWEAYLAAFNAASNRATRSMTLVVARNTAKAAFLAVARELYAGLQASTTLSDAMKTAAGVLVPKTSPTPVPKPDAPPGISVVSAVGNTVRLRFYDTQTAGRRGRPPGSAGLNLFTFVGPTPPAGPAGWTFERGVGRNTADVAFDPDLPPGTRVWFTAAWFNPRKQSGPAAPAVGANLPGGGVSMRVSMAA